MMDWKTLLKNDPTPWLLEEDDPSVRYFTLTTLLERPEDDPEVLASRSAIMTSGPVKKILAAQEKDGYWDAPDRFYLSKYKGTVWQLMILAELGADGKDERIKNACEFVFENSQDRETGGFSIERSKKFGGGLPSMVIPCLTANMVWSMIRFGYLDDERVQRGIEWIAEYQRFDDGDAGPPKGWRYEKMVACFGKHTCHMGAVKALKALAEVPAKKRTKAVKDTIERGAEYMLMHRVHKKSHDLSKDSKPGWKKFGFPLMYQTDIVEILGVLTRLGYRDERMQEAFDILVAKQDERGRWKMENTFNGKMQTDIEKKKQPSKWVTLKALQVIKGYHT